MSGWTSEKPTKKGWCGFVLMLDYLDWAAIPARVDQDGELYIAGCDVAIKEFELKDPRVRYWEVPIPPFPEALP